MTDTSSIDELMAADSPTTPDRLAAIRTAAKRRRSLALERASLEERLTTINKAAEVLERETLPDLFAAAGVDRIDVPPEGNEPGFAARLTPYYKANIQADWPAEQRAAAFARLAEIGLGDIVKNVVTVTFGRDEVVACLGFQKLLDDNNVRYAVAQSVPWSTLTAALKDLCENDRRPDDATLNAIGASVGRIVKLKDQT